jgi:amino acid transporter
LRPQATALDAAIYPVLMKDYLISGNLWPELERSQTTQTVFMILSVVLMSALNYFGLKLVGWVAVVLVIICIMPFIVFVVVGIPQVKTSRWSETLDNPADFDTGLYLNTLFWNLNYFDSASQCPRSAIERCRPRLNPEVHSVPR